MRFYSVLSLLAVSICTYGVSGVPVQIGPRDKSYVPEQYPLKMNGPLPEGVSVIQGYCENCTMYPEENSVTALSSSKQDYRTASETEIQAHTFYTALSANAYCRNVIPGGRWSCPHCDVTSNLKITKTFSTLITDTNVAVAVGEKEKTIYIVFRGTNSIRNAIAVGY
ncbi:b34959triacylglycerol lipase (ec) precursor 2-rhizomucor miehei [Lichtheimia corymbifera JMRC:FSU:9682]|uniref:B34959triacylglycerol lipase (Ec ) 2-rhizomucor miehei n=1 Tax=Lichtheimia corymbifera JMRC:FSU:9682 TaxID=1263082 RepID=A0A068RNY9_9FUNG|nr:b34959triacylglycerol lipase (ec) precursor 2-rhizomucor miehei [Lichtheimia corymbifera JMRC:FSU:9682]